MSGGAVLLLSNRSWLGNWGDTTMAATNALLFVLPMVVVAGAVDARRLFTPARAAPASGCARRPPAVVARAVAAVATWASAGYMILLITGFAATARANPQLVPLPWWWIAAGMTSLLVYSALGVVLGCFVPLPVTIALAGLLGVVANAVLADSAESDASLFTPTSNGLLGGPFVARPGVALLQVSLGVVLAAALIAAVALTIRVSRVGAALTAMLLVATVATGTALAATEGGRVMQLDGASGPRECTSDGVVCLWRDQAGDLDVYAPLARAMATAIGTDELRGWTALGLAAGEKRAVLGLAPNNLTPALAAVVLAEAALFALAPNADSDRAGCNSGTQRPRPDESPRRRGGTRRPRTAPAGTS